MVPAMKTLKLTGLAVPPYYDHVIGHTVPPFRFPIPNLRTIHLSYFRHMRLPYLPYLCSFSGFVDRWREGRTLGTSVVDQPGTNRGKSPTEPLQILVEEMNFERISEAEAQELQISMPHVRVEVPVTEPTNWYDACWS